MATPISNRTARLRQRRYDPEARTVILKEATRVGGWEPQLTEPQRYIVESIQPVPPAYTEKTMRECSRVQNQVNKALVANDVRVEFDHQGSVTNNTHIRLHSDIDLLVIPDYFVYLNPPLVVNNPYRGDGVAELVRIRQICRDALEEAYPAADVDGDGSMCISISGGSLARKVDVVPAAWLDTQEYISTWDKVERGIRVLDASVLRLIDNFPFLHNSRIDGRDREAGGRLRPLIRLVKSIRSDSDKEPNVSSYHIAGLCYHLPLQCYDNDPRVTLHAFVVWTSAVLSAPAVRQSLLVPNETELLFARIKEAELRTLLAEATDLLRLAA